MSVLTLPHHWTPAAHCLMTTQAAVAGGNPGHWEGEARVSARAPPAPCSRPLS